MKAVKAILLVTFVSLGYQTKYIFAKADNPVQETACAKGELAAKNDFQKNELGYYFYGYPNPRFNTWMRLMIEAFDLKIKGGGCIVEKEGECYNRVMSQKIMEKFGADAFDKIDARLDSLYEVGLGDREATFVGGKSALLKYIDDHIEDELLSDNVDTTPLVIVQFSIAKDGQVGNPRIIRQNRFAKEDKRYEIKVFQLIESMPDWMPAVANMVSAPAECIVPIRFGLHN